MIQVVMQVFARATLREFWERHPDTEETLQSWYKVAEQATWNTPADVRRSCANARVIGRDRVIFNIRGNNYRLVVRIDYPLKKVYVRFIGTHAEYDRINALEV